MIPQLKDILGLIEDTAPSHTAEDWDNPGLQVGVPSQEVSKVFFALDPTLRAVKEAAKEKAQLLLTHHPLIFQPLSRINREVYPGSAIFEAFKNNISIVAAHTNLDVTQGGINDMLAQPFLLKDVEVLQAMEGITGHEVGLGRIGNVKESMSLSAMIELVQSVLGTKGIRFVGSKNLKIRRVALVGGSGGGMVPTASERGADLLITGDFSHHDAMEAHARGLAVIDGGHFYTEKAALALYASRFKGLLEERGWEVDVAIYKDERNPIQYVS
jgi:dinuclear metal center YbgI/SA1388 family protein